MTNETKDFPTDPLADASTGVVRRSRGAFQKSTPLRRPDRRRPDRDGKYTGPERRVAEDSEPERAEGGSPLLFGFPRWMVLAGVAYLVALGLAMLLIFTY